MRKFGGGMLAAAMVLSVGLMAAPGGAATGAQCTKLATKTVGSKITATLSGCTPTTATGGSGSGTFVSNPAKTGTLNITITWAAKTGTTTATIKFAPAKGLGKCPKGTTSRVTLTGSVTGGTGTAVKTITKGQAVSASVCLAKTYTPEPGTAVKF